MTKLLAWLQLMRVSALPTAMSNILAGFLLNQQSWNPAFDLLLLVGCSSCLYVSGMILNDYCDRDSDAKLRSKRPIPEGRIFPRTAFFAYLVLTILGLVLASLVGLNSFLIALLLVTTIFAYDYLLKKTILAPIVMGSCRTLNILLGASLASDSQWLDFPPMVLWIAVIIGLFICGLTWFARNEAEQSQRPQLIAAACLIGASIAALAFTGFMFQSTAPIQFLAAVTLISIPATYRVTLATITTTPVNVQRAIRSLLQSLILFDACICLLARPDQPFFALATAALIIPAMLLSRFISST